MHSGYRGTAVPKVCPQAFSLFPLPTPLDQRPVHRLGVTGMAGMTGMTGKTGVTGMTRRTELTGITGVTGMTGVTWMIRMT